MSGDLIYTVGHSNRERTAFVELLLHWGIEVLVDIRAVPRSRRFPHFASDVLRPPLSAAGITYHWAGRQLGGMREPDPGSPHVALKNGLRGYADHMSSTAFRQGVVQLKHLSGVQPTAMMCAEKEPLHCHRSLLADHLLLDHGVEIRHLISKDEWRRHELRPEARTSKKGTVYDRHAQTEIELQVVP